jgi:hypothetical protein
MLSDYRSDMNGRELVKYVFRETTNCNLMTTAQIMGDGFRKDMRVMAQQVEDSHVSRIAKGACKAQIRFAYFVGAVERFEHDLASAILG